MTNCRGGVISDALAAARWDVCCWPNSDGRKSTLNGRPLHCLVYQGGQRHHHAREWGITASFRRWCCPCRAFRGPSSQLPPTL